MTKQIHFWGALFASLLAVDSLAASGCFGDKRKVVNGFISYGDDSGTWQIPIFGRRKSIYTSVCEGEQGLTLRYPSRQAKINADGIALREFYTGKTINGITIVAFEPVERAYAVTEEFKSCKDDGKGLYIAIYRQEKPPEVIVSVQRNCPADEANKAAEETKPVQPVAEKTDEEKYAEELAALEAVATLHRYTIGPIQKQRMLAKIRHEARRSGLTGQRLTMHMRGAQMVVNGVGERTFNLELKSGGKMLFTQSGQSKIMTYRIRGNLLEIEKSDGKYKPFGRFNGSKSTLSLLDPVYGKEVVAVLER